MPIEILMPALSPTMTEGNLAKWLKKEGDKVKPGDVIAEIETDKATMEVEAVDEGVLGKIVIGGGTEAVKVNQLIAVLLEDGEDKSSIDAFIAKHSIPGAAPSAAAQAAPSPAAAPQASTASQQIASSGKIAASPLAKRVANQSGIDLSGITGTGPHGRIIKADVEEASSSGGAKQSRSAYIPAQVGRNSAEYSEIPVSGMRKIIAKRLVESKQQVPHFYLSADCEIDALMKARKRLNTLAEEAAGKDKPAYKLTVNDFVIKASAMALRQIPEANASWAENVVHQYNNIDIAVAVAIEGGLITPIIRNADQKSLSEISNEMKSLASRARENKLRPEEFQGGGFSVSNLGMYGVKNFQAIINPPQSCILAIGAGEERVVAKDGEFKVVNIMNATLSVDHRVVDGAVGALLLAAFKRFIEEPVLMLA